MSPADLKAGIDGLLEVGAGGNDVSKATEVGTFTAQLSGSTLSFTYELNDDTFDLSEVHVQASCKAPTTCAPGSTHILDLPRLWQGTTTNPLPDPSRSLAAALITLSSTRKSARGFRCRPLVQMLFYERALADVQSLSPPDEDVLKAFAI